MTDVWINLGTSVAALIIALAVAVSHWIDTRTHRKAPQIADYSCRGRLPVSPATGNLDSPRQDEHPPEAGTL